MLGILSIVLCQLLGPVAWKLGSDEMRAITEGTRPPDGLGLAQAGRICGIVGTCLLGPGSVCSWFSSLVALLLGFGIFVAEALGVDDQLRVAANPRLSLFDLGGNPIEGGRRLAAGSCQRHR